jgi:flagellar biosynthesis GTPase FlhF
MASKSSVRKNTLAQKIRDEGFKMVFSCVRCNRLGKECFKSADSSRCSECVLKGITRCVESKPSYSDSEWQRLVNAQRKIREDERKTAEELQTITARLNRLHRQEELLRNKANEFISHEFKEIAELEALERQEEEELARMAEEKRKAEEDRQQLITLLGLHPSTGDDQLASVFSLPSGSSTVDP